MFIGKGTEMIVVLRNNSYLIRKKRTFKDRRMEYVAAAKYHKTTYEKADPEILKALRKKLLRERRKGIYKSIVILFVSIAITYFFIDTLLKALT